jgi:hypothetical protein
MNFHVHSTASSGLIQDWMGPVIGDNGGTTGSMVCMVGPIGLFSTICTQATDLDAFAIADTSAEDASTIWRAGHE